MSLLLRRSLNKLHLKKNPCVLKSRTFIMTLQEARVEDAVVSEQNSLSWLHSEAPGFPIHGSKIKIITEPMVFYTTLLEKCKTAKKRIALASLYLGTGELETDLVNEIKTILSKEDSNVQVDVLLDYMRGSRGQVNSRKMLEPLLQDEWKSRCRVFLYHTPRLRGFLKAVIPDRFNELIGLQHMKLYIFDDTLIISGANLSNDYFTNRQDRYFVIENCEDLCQFYFELIDVVGEFSFQLSSDPDKVMEPKYNPLNTEKSVFLKAVYEKINLFIRQYKEKQSRIFKDESSNANDTYIFPLIQMGDYGLQNDSKITLKLLQTALPGSTLRLATGYFNLTDEYVQAILKSCRATVDLLTAHPSANGFFKAKGVAGGIPAAYTKMETSFCKLCEKMQQNDRITLWEYKKPGWTYHAKGLWYTLPGKTLPCLTFIGSPNFGYRSVKRDLETQIAILTKNEELQKELQKEYKKLFSNAEPVNAKSLSQSGRIPLWVSATVLFFRYYF